MERPRLSDLCSNLLLNLIGVLLLFSMLWALIGCQGVSSGTQSNQPQSGTLSLSSTSLNFGSVAVGSSKTVSTTATNSGSASLTINSVSFASKVFTLASPNLPVTVAAGQSTPLSITFTPNASGTVNSSTSIASNASNPSARVALTGSGTVAATQLAVSPATLSIGSVVVGSSGTASGTLTASGGAVTVTAATSNSTAFTLGGISLPLTIAAGQSVPFNVTFSPQVAGTASATLTFTGNAQPPTTTESVTGSGTPAPTHSVNLSWTASTSSSVSGYNIYRSPYAASCGSLTKINALLNTGTLYTDSTVTSGASYCYAATTVNSSNLESAYSNIVTNVQIPNP